MNCFSCGNPTPEKAVFCPNCGTKLEGMQELVPALVTESAASQPEPVAADPEPEPEAVTSQPEPEFAVSQPESAAPASDAVAQITQPVLGYGAPEYFPPVAEQANPDHVPPAGSYAAPAAVQVPPMGAQAQPVYAKGCVAAAVADVKGDPLLTKNMLLMGLIECVPILNFVVYGYALNWAREIPRGGRTGMSAKIINGQNFEIGFYAFVISLVIGLIVGLASTLLAFIPILGAIVVLAISLGASMFQFLLQMRMGMAQQLGEGFKVQAAWNVMRRNWTGLLCAVFVPSLVATGIILAVSLVAMLIIAGASVPMILAEASMAMGVAAVGYGLVVALICLAIIFACGVCVAAVTTVSFRAVGHWVARYAPEWVAETQQPAYYSTMM